MTESPESPPRGDPASADPSDVAARLDSHHDPETNGRMAICRRCGVQTEGPAGRHRLADQRSATRAATWLERQAHLARIGHYRDIAKT